MLLLRCSIIAGRYSMKFIGIWLCIISIAAFVITIYDKWAAVHNPRHRTPEATLLAISAIGGSIAMLCTMLVIRHKTKHMKFMIGIPLIIILQIAAAVALKIYIL